MVKHSGARKHNGEADSACARGDEDKDEGASDRKHDRNAASVPAGRNIEVVSVSAHVVVRPRVHTKGWCGIDYVDGCVSSYANDCTNTHVDGCATGCDG